MPENPSSAGDLPAQVNQLREQLRLALAELDERKRELEELRERIGAVQSALPEEQPEVCLRTEIRQLLHDLRSPLSAISNWVQLNPSFLSDESTRVEGMQIMSLSIDQMTSMLNECAVRTAR